MEITNHTQDSHLDSVPRGPPSSFKKAPSSSNSHSSKTHLGSFSDFTIGNRRVARWMSDRRVEFATGDATWGIKPRLYHSEADSLRNGKSSRTFSSSIGARAPLSSRDLRAQVNGRKSAFGEFGQRCRKLVGHFRIGPFATLAFSIDLLHARQLTSSPLWFRFLGWHSTSPPTKRAASPWVWLRSKTNRKRNLRASCALGLALGRKNSIKIAFWGNGWRGMRVAILRA